MHAVINLWLSLITNDKINMQLLPGFYHTLSKEWAYIKILVIVSFLEKPVMSYSMNLVRKEEF